MRAGTTDMTFQRGKGIGMQSQQEQQLLSAFRAMHPDDRVLIIEFARDRAKEQSGIKSNLQLVISNSSPFHGSTLCGSSGERKYI